MAPAAFEQLLSVLENVKADGIGFHKCIRRLCKSTEALKKLLLCKTPEEDSFIIARLEGPAKEFVIPEIWHIIVCRLNADSGFEIFNSSVPVNAMLDVEAKFTVTLGELRL
jgi:hypothetical protein